MNTSWLYVAARLQQPRASCAPARPPPLPPPPAGGQPATAGMLPPSDSEEESSEESGAEEEQGVPKVVMIQVGAGGGWGQRAPAHV